MPDSTDPTPVTVSAFRMRLGLILLVLWWIPFWLAAPFISDLLGVTSSEGQHQVFLAIIVIQTVLGLVGGIIIGKQAAAIMKGTPLKKAPRKAWHVLWTGKLE